MVEHRVGWLDPIFIGLSWAGAEGAIWLLIAAVVAFLQRRPFVLLYVGAAVAVADLGSHLLRAAIGRDRPADVYPNPKPLIGVPHDPALPSGHASVAFASATILSFMLPRFAVPFFVLAALIAWSRVYVGAHYPLDVLAGAAFGVLVAIALRWLLGALQRSRRAKPAG